MFEYDYTYFISEIPTVTVESLCRSKSESQAAYYADEEDEDEDYGEYKTDFMQIMLQFIDYR